MPKNQKSREINRYQTRGPYHWQYISKSIRHHNAIACARYQEILSSLGNIKGKKVLDLGGGDGVMSYLMNKAGANSFNLDLSLVGLKYAAEKFKQHKKVSLGIVASVESIPFPNDFFDAAICCEVIEHIHNPEKLLADSYRVIRKGGKMIISTPLKLTEKPLVSTHTHEYFSDELTGLIRKFFSNVHIKTYAPVVYVELFNQKPSIFLHRRGFKLIFNVLSIFFRKNMFKSSKNYKYFTSQIAISRK
jgi:ubiquinone/menaquinone biosynthesis C-methylase UbiE